MWKQVDEIKGNINPQDKLMINGKIFIRKKEIKT